MHFNKEKIGKENTGKDEAREIIWREKVRERERERETEVARERERERESKREAYRQTETE